jgi:hypothetical protein
MVLVKLIYRVCFVSLLVLLTSCSNNIKQGAATCLINNFVTEKTKKMTISELIGKNYKLTELNENGNRLIGKINKILKRKNNYFILSDDNRIYQFDEKGNFYSLLNKLGKGPEEYTRIEDFDVYNLNGEVYLWLANANFIKIYKFNNGWKLVDTVKFPFVVHKFKRVDDTHILLMTGKKDKSLTLVNMQGNTIKEFLDKEIPFLTFRPVQFLSIDSSIIFPLGMSNSFVSYHSNNEEFSFGNYISGDEFLSKEELLTMFKKKGYDYFLELKNKCYIKSIRSFGDRFVVDYSFNNSRALAVVNHNGQGNQVRFGGELTILNDITSKKEARFLLSLLIADSDNSLLFVQEPEEMSEKYVLIEFFE